MTTTALARTVTLLVLLVLVTAPPVHSQSVASVHEAPRKVLIFSGVDPTLPGVLIINQILRETLERSLGRVEFYSESLDHSRIPDETYEQEMIRYLQQKYKGEHFDLTFAVSSSGLRFLLKHNDEIFQNTPTIFVNTTDHEIEGLALGPNVTGVQGTIELRPALDVALSLQPGTRRVVVVTGTSNQDKFWEGLARKEFRSYEGEIGFEYLTNVTVEELRQRLAALPPGTIVFFLNFLLDSAGNGYSTPEAVSLVAPSSSSPIYVVLESAFREGVVGGRMISYEAIGRSGAELGLRVIAGERPTDIPPETVPSVTIFDWRQLRRWGIEEAKVPPGSVVRFKELTLWEEHKWSILGFGLLCILEALLIAYLLINRRKRRRAEEETARLAAGARAQSDRLEEIVGNVPGVVWEARVDPATNTRTAVFVSPLAESMLGYSVAEWLETSGFAESIIHEDDRDKAASEIDAILESGRAGVVRFRWVAKDGHALWVETHLAVTRDEAGEISGLRGVTLDITERIAAEAQAIEQRAELAHLARVTILGELLGSLSHELNQPLTAILTNAQAAQRFLAQDEADLDEVREILADIVDEDNRAAELIHRLRLLFKKGEMQLLPLDGNTAVREVLKLIRGDLLNRGVTALTELWAELPAVNGDRVQLQQVLLNLVVNASDAMKANQPGDRVIVVRTELCDGARVQFSVSDRGPGLPAGELERVFEPFVTSKPQGLGLGLSVCRLIVTAHGGKLWVSNNPERGATFFFTLPVNGEAGLQGDLMSGGDLR